MRVGAAKPGDIQYSLVVVKARDDQSDELSSPSPSSSGDEFLLGTVRFCFIRDKENRGNNSQEWIWFRSLCVHTAHRGQGWSRKLLEMALPALHQLHDPNTADTPIYCFAKAALGNRLYVPFGFRPVTANLGGPSSLTPQPDKCDAGPGEQTAIPNSLRQRYSSIVRRLSATQGNDDDAVDLECFGYFYCGNETAANSMGKRNSRPMPPLVNLQLLILQHERETGRKTGTAQLVLEESYDNNDILGLNVTATTWAGRSDTERVERLLRDKQQQQRPNGDSNNLVLLWPGGTSDVSSFLATPCNDEPNNIHENFCNSNPTTFILLDGTWQEAQTMFRKIQLLWNLPRLSLRATQSSRYRLRQDYGWKKKFDSTDSDGGGDVETSLLCTAEVMAELLQQTGNAEGAATIRNRLETFMARLRPIKKE